MANTVTVTTIQNSQKFAILHLYIAGDGTGEVTNSTVYNFSTDTYAPSAAKSLWIEQIWAATDAFSVSVIWDGATPFQAWGQGNNFTTHAADFSNFGGIPNKATTPNGNLTVTTTGLGAGEHLFMIVKIRKS